MRDDRLHTFPDLDSAARSEGYDRLLPGASLTHDLARFLLLAAYIHDPDGQHLDLEDLLNGAPHLDAVGLGMNFEVLLIRSVSRDRALFRDQRLLDDLIQFHYDINAPSIL